MDKRESRVLQNRRVPDIMKAVIMAGGLGKRLEPFTTVIPKPLLPIGEKSILELMIQRLKQCGCDEVFIATNYKSDLFEKYFKYLIDPGIKITISKETEPLGTAGPLKLLKSSLKEPFLVMNGDILTTLDFNKLKNVHIMNNAKLTIATKEMEMPLYYGVIESSDGIRVDNVKEKPSVKSEINAGIYFVNPEVINEIPDGLYHMTDLIKALLSKKMVVVKYKIDEYWLDIGQLSTYQKAQEDVKKYGLFN